MVRETETELEALLLLYQECRYQVMHALLFQASLLGIGQNEAEWLCVRGIQSKYTGRLIRVLPADTSIRLFYLAAAGLESIFG